MSRAVKLANRSAVVQKATSNGTMLEAQGHVLLTRVDDVVFFTVLVGGVASDA